MFEDNGAPNYPMRQQNAVSNNFDSSFYTSSLKSGVFNFTAEPKSSSNVVTCGSNSPSTKLVHTSEKRRGDDLFSNNGIPHKYYLCETAMANHFAQMNLALPVDATKIVNYNNLPSVAVSPSFPFDPSQVASAHHIYQNLSVCTSKEASTNDSDNEDESDEDTEDNRSPLRFSDDLKEHLRCSRVNPTNAFLKGLLSSEPSLAIVPFNPDRLKVLSPSNSSNESPKEDSGISALSDNQLLDSVTSSPSSSFINSIFCIYILYSIIKYFAIKEYTIIIT
ncbi:unnamed protein product [Trichobilharzia szidati]|nr:unnamed protein product [Trichobilharzia szidati]